jgi:hypothetical protein
MPKIFTQKDFEKGICDKDGCEIKPDAVKAVEEMTIEVPSETTTGDPEQSNIEVNVEEDKGE